MEHPKRFPLPIKTTWRMYAVAATLMVLAIIEIQFAEPSRNFFKQFIEVSQLVRFLDTADHIADHLIWFSLVIGVWVVAPRFRHTIIPAALAVGLASGFTGIGKEITGRTRPYAGLAMSSRESSIRWAQEHIDNHPRTILRIEDRDYWFWFTPDRPWFTGRIASFPSGHATSVATLAVWLTIMMPKAYVWWWFLAFLCCLSRIHRDRHYPADVMAGTAVGYLTAYWLFGNAWLAVKSEQLTRYVELKFHGFSKKLPYGFGGGEDPTSKTTSSGQSASE